MNGYMVTTAFTRTLLLKVLTEQSSEAFTKLQIVHHDDFVIKYKTPDNNLVEIEIISMKGDIAYLGQDYQELAVPIADIAQFAGFHQLTDNEVTRIEQDELLRHK